MSSLSESLKQLEFWISVRTTHSVDFLLLSSCDPIPASSLLPFSFHKLHVALQEKAGFSGRGCFQACLQWGWWLGVGRHPVTCPRALKFPPMATSRWIFGAGSQSTPTAKQTTAHKWIAYEHFLSHSAGGLEFKLRVPAQLGEGPLPGWRLLPASQGGRREGALWGLSYRALIPVRAPPAWPLYTQRPHLLTPPSHLGGYEAAYEFRGTALWA